MFKDLYFIAQRTKFFFQELNKNKYKLISYKQIPKLFSNLKYFYLYTENNKWYDIWYYLLLFTISIFFPNNTRWFEYIRNDYLLTKLHIKTYLLWKPIDTLYDIHLNENDRTNILINTYTITKQIFGLNNYISLLQDNMILLHKFKGIQYDYKISFKHERTWHREGLFALIFETDVNVKILYQLLFHFDYENGEIVCRIGNCQRTCRYNSQGSNIEQPGITNLRAIVADLYNLHPFICLIHFLKQFCLYYKIYSLEGIGSNNHYWNCTMKKHNNKYLNIKYDDIWKQNHGIQKINGNYDIPLYSLKKDVHRNKDILKKKILDLIIFTPIHSMSLENIRLNNSNQNIQNNLSLTTINVKNFELNNINKLIILDKKEILDTLFIIDENGWVSLDIIKDKFKQTNLGLAGINKFLIKQGFIKKRSNDGNPGFSGLVVK